MTRGNIASVSWLDHLVFGEGDGRLATPDALAGRMDRWRDELGAATLHWHEARTRRDQGRTFASPCNPRTAERRIREIAWDDFAVAPRLAHERGMGATLCVSILDEGRPLPPKWERERDAHSALRDRDVTWQSSFSRANSHYTVTDRGGEAHQWGVLCFGYPEVRDHFRRRIIDYTGGYAWDSVLLSLHTEARPAAFADQFGFNPPVQEAMQEQHGVDILTQDFDLELWRTIQGEFFTTFLRELRSDLNERGIGLSVGVPRGDVIGPPVGNWSIQWRTWADEGLIDALAIDQHAWQSPSLVHQHWPGQGGYGYVQNALDDLHIAPLPALLRDAYGPVAKRTGIACYVARQWEARSPESEAALTSDPGVAGLAFSTFRHDNPGVIARGEART